LKPPISVEDREAVYADIAAEVALLERQGNLLKKVVRLVQPCVVHIEAEKVERTVRGASKTVEEAGSGILLNIGGKIYVLTNRHVVNDSPLDKIDIGLWDGRVVHPTKMWGDPETDIAVLKIDGARLIAAKLGDSRKVEIGDFVLAVGSPFGLSHSVTYGIVSATGRRDLELGPNGVRYQDFLQTDAAINPGNSGGPLISLRGEVIGVNTAIASSGGGNEGIGFAIPIHMARVIAQQLVSQGRVVRAFLGVHLDSQFNADQALGLGLPRKQGARVSGTTPDAPAATAGVLVGDVIVKFNGQLVEDDDHLVNIVGLTAVEKTVEIVVWRDRQLTTLRTQLGDRKKLFQQP